MKKRFGFITVMLAAILAVSGVGCNNGGNGQGSGKTVLNVWNYDGGVGHTWLDAVIERFEADNAETVFENGKKGIDINKIDTKDDAEATIASSPYSVYFLEGVYYNNWQTQNKFLEITDIVTEKIEGEEKSIEDKMNANTKASLSASGKYYVLPHYQSLNGVSYNKTMFDSMNLYFAATPEDSFTNDVNSPMYGMIKNKDSKKSCGPDGVFDTYDDGLPSSVEEYSRLCKAVKAKGGIPFIWYGGGESYQTSFVNALWASLEGYDGAMANFLLDSNGKETEIVTKINADGTVETTKTVITENNFSDVYQQVSRYYALKMAHEIMTDRTYYHKDSLTDTVSHTDIQGKFLESFYNGEKIAMIFEGSYWQNEAKASGEMDRVISKYPDAKNLEIKIMPLPIKATGSVKEGEGRAPTSIDTLNSYAFINSNVRAKHGEGVEKAAKAFLKYCYTDKSLVEFTLKSSVTKNLSYDLGEKVSELSTYSQSVYNVYKTGNVVTSISPKTLAIKNHTIFTLHPGGDFWNTKTGAGYKVPSVAFRNNVSVKDYFDGMKKDAAWLEGLNK